MEYEKVTISPIWPNTWSRWQETSENGQTIRRHRIRLSLKDLRDLHLNLDLSRLSRPEITVIAPKSFGPDGAEEIRRLFRLDGSLPRLGQTLVFPTMPPDWLRDRYPGLAPDNPWRLPEFHDGMTRPIPSHVAPWWEIGARGWAVAMLMLLLFVLLARAAEKCLHRRLLSKLLRRQSEEWPTPNVLATSSNPQDSDIESLPRMYLDGFPSEGSIDNLSNDLPPPYSECANPNEGPKPPTHEEPPPPYTACYVAFSNPKDGNPSVHFYNSQRQNLFESSLGQSSQDVSETNEVTESVNPEAQNAENDVKIENVNVEERETETVAISDTELQNSVALSSVLVV